MESAPDPPPPSQNGSEPRSVFVLVGPTASGKTPISLRIAERLNAEIISADSRQIYKQMDVGTAKPSTDDRRRVRHYFVDELFPDEEFNAFEFGKKGREIIDDIFRRGKIPLIVGGSGLYVQALIDGFFEGPPADDTMRKELFHRMDREGAGALLNELRRVDPEAAVKMLPSHRRRIVRALEVYNVTGIPISEKQKTSVKIDFTPVFAGLLWDRKKIYERINRRADAMIAEGLIGETKRLVEIGYAPSLNALQTVGYKEVFGYLSGSISLPRMVELVKQSTRRYAKRQLTWFRRDRRIHWFAVGGEEEFERVALEITEYFVASGNRNAMAPSGETESACRHQ